MLKVNSLIRIKGRYDSRLASARLDSMVHGTIQVSRQDAISFTVGNPIYVKPEVPKAKHE
jgi:hypothetical protein